MTTMSKPLKMTAVALSALVASQTMIAAPAEASHRGRVAGAVAAGFIAGAVIAGTAMASDRAVYIGGDGCGWLRRRALEAESMGRYGRAEYYWNRFAECRG